MAARRRSLDTNLRLPLPPTGELLSDDTRAEAVSYVLSADGETKRRWQEVANRVVDSLLSRETLERSTEPSLQGTFLDAVFVRLLGYSGALSGRRPFTLSEHVTTEIDATEADATLGWFTSPGTGQTLAVVELKDARTNLDLRQLSRRDRLTPVDQAFLYSSKFAGCKWVIVSNFVEIRLYSTQHGQTLHETFQLTEFRNQDRLFEFVALFGPQSLIGPDPATPPSLQRLLVERPAVRDLDITNRFYERYSNERNRLLQHFLEQQTDARPDQIIWATQKLLDRILFICFAEDTRTLLPPRVLRQTAEVAERSRSRSPTKIWDEIRELFRDIDEGRRDLTPPIPAYNGGLFAHDELLDEKLHLTDSLAWELVEFSDFDYRAINVEILGHIFEQSVSDLETLHRVHSLDPDAVEADALAMADTRRAVGIYYTPRWVTEYIVEATLGRAASRTGFDTVSLQSLTILDPACGSGAFLAQAYRYLLEVAAAAIPEALPSEQATLESASSLLRPSTYLRTLHGLDLMPEAVEIARLSLWLASANPHERLQSLEGIWAGNTLEKINGGSALNHAFKDEMDAGGFDVAVGNPPWGADIDYEIDPSFDLAHGQYDSYELFVERALRDAVRSGGFFGFIVPDRILRPEGQRLRRWLFDNYRVLEILKLGEGVFPSVFRASVILIVEKTPPTEKDRIRTLVAIKADRDMLENTGSTHLRSLVEERGGLVSRSRIVGESGYDIPLGATDQDLDIMETMKAKALSWTGPTGLFEPYGRGVELGADGFVVRCNACFEWQVGPRRRSQSRGGGHESKTCSFCRVTLTESEWQDQAELIVEEAPSNGSLLDRRLPGKGWAPLYVGEDVSRYFLSPPRWIRLGVPNINYKEEQLYAPPKLLIRQAGVGVNVALDETPSLCLQSVYSYKVAPHLDVDPYYLLACLASRSMLFHFHRLTNQVEWQSFPKLVHRTLQQLPLPEPDLDSKRGRSLHDTIAEQARRRMGLSSDSATHELDLELERLVMDAYGLEPSHRQRITSSLRSVQRLRVIREMFPTEDLAANPQGSL